MAQSWHLRNRRWCYDAAMLQAVGAIVFLVLAYTVLALFAEHLPPAWASGAAFLVPLIGVAAVAFAFAPGGKREP